MWTFIYRFVACFCKNISANIYQENNSEWNNCLLKIEWNNCLLSLTYATQQTLKYISNFYPSVFYCSNSWIKFFLKLHFFSFQPSLNQSFPLNLGYCVLFFQLLPPSAVSCKIVPKAFPKPFNSFHHQFMFGCPSVRA